MVNKIIYIFIIQFKVHKFKYIHLLFIGSESCSNLKISHFFLGEEENNRKLFFSSEISVIGIYSNIFQTILLTL